MVDKQIQVDALTQYASGLKCQVDTLKFDLERKRETIENLKSDHYIALHRERATVACYQEYLDAFREQCALGVDEILRLRAELNTLKPVKLLEHSK